MARPNFVFIMTDSQGAMDVGCYGNPALRTPNLDRLASEGVRFNRAYSTCPICGPARGGIFSGTYPHTCGTWGNELPLTQTTKTMGQRFQDAGYHTAFIGKWHLSGQDYFDTGICPEGWDDAYWYDGRRYLAELTDEEIHLWRQVLTTTEALKAHDVPADFTWGHRISDRAIRFLEQQPDDEPFVLALSYDEPHGPCTCPWEFVAPFEHYYHDPGPSKNYDMSRKPAMHRRLHEQYRGTWELTDGQLFYPPFFGCNSFVDMEIGRVLDAVARHAPPNTWVIFTSDHGQFEGAHGLLGKGVVMYEESARIPLFICGPQAQAGRVSETPVSHIDILPTMLAIAGLETPPVLEGDSLLPHVTDGVEHPDREVVIEWNRADEDAHNAAGGLYPARCIIRDTYKLVVNLFDTDELYDLATDPHELENRIDDPALATLRDELHDHLLLWMNDTRDPFRGTQWLNRPWHHADPKLIAGRKVRPNDGYLPPTLDYMTGQPEALLHTQAL